jgi:hypothetical protein
MASCVAGISRTTAQCRGALRISDVRTLIALVLGERGFQVVRVVAQRLCEQPGSGDRQACSPTGQRGCAVRGVADQHNPAGVPRSHVDLTDRIEVELWIATRGVEHATVPKTPARWRLPSAGAPVRHHRPNLACRREDARCGHNPVQPRVCGNFPYLLSSSATCLSVISVPSVRNRAKRDGVTLAEPLARQSQAHRPWLY